jgi:hypothetical protein
MLADFKTPALWADLHEVRRKIDRILGNQRQRGGGGGAPPGYRPEPAIDRYLSQSATALPSAVRAAIGPGHFEMLPARTTSA